MPEDNINSTVASTSTPGSSISSSAVPDAKHLASTQHEPNNWDKPFWRSVFSDDFGTGSTNRIGTLMVVVFTLGILTYLVVHTNNIPENIMRLGYFSALLITTVYSPAKIAGIMKSYFAKKQ